jgi:hypothetical protein
VQARHPAPVGCNIDFPQIGCMPLNAVDLWPPPIQGDTESSVRCEYAAVNQYEMAPCSTFDPSVEDLRWIKIDLPPLPGCFYGFAQVIWSASVFVSQAMANCAQKRDSRKPAVPPLDLAHTTSRYISNREFAVSQDASSGTRLAAFINRFERAPLLLLLSAVFRPSGAPYAGLPPFLRTISAHVVDQLAISAPT